MPDDPRVEQLLEELLDSGGTPEDACRTCPELLPQVRAGWQRLRALQAEVGALFPPSPACDAATAPPLPTAGLPRIPGYEVQEVLGRGGMGVVYKAWHRRLSRAVALKMLLAGPFARPEELERFLREAEAVAGLRHANVVQVHNIGDLDGRPYFTMEYVEGGSLAQKLAGTPQPADQAAALVATLAEAIQVAHQSGIVHRDLKPANILLTADGIPKVTDFGLARRLAGGKGLTLSGVPVGTPSYMAPEQGRSTEGTIGPATDVYALGAILYEMLTGRPPFRAETAAATLQQVLAEDPVPPSRLNPRVPRDLETICLKCLHKEPPRRYASAAALAEDLQRYGRGEPIAARPAGRLERLARWVRRHPAAAGLLAALTLLVAVAGTGALLLYQQRLAARARQDETDQKLLAILGREHDLLEEGWRTHDLAKLTEARDGGIRAADLVRSGGASAAVQQEAEAFRQDAALRLARGKKNQELLDAVLDLLDTPTLGVQYAAAFRRWGLDVDRTPEDEVVERLRQEPDAVRQELIAALDAWMLERRLSGRPEAEWRRLFRLAEQLDESEQHRRLRACLVGAPPRADAVVGFVGTGSPWTALWELARGQAWLGLLESRRETQPQTAPVLTVLLLSRALAAVGDVVGAEEVLRQAATARPEQVLLLYALGKLLERQGPSRLEAAIGYYRAARGQRPQLGTALSRAFVAANRPTEVREVMQDLVRRQPGNPVFYIWLGIAAYEQKKVGDARAFFRKALDLDPNLAGAHYALGIILGDEGQFAEAEAAYHKAIELKPDYTAAHFRLGIILLRRGKPREAEAAFRKAIELKSLRTEAHVGLGNALIDPKPDYAEAYNNLAIALGGQRRFGEAEAAYRKAIELQPDYALAYSNLGLVLHDQGKDIEAEAVCRQSIDLQPNATAYNHLGLALYGQRKPLDAEAAFRQAIELQPDLAQAHCNLGGALNDRQKYGEAEAALRTAIDLKADYAEAYYNLAVALFRQQKPAAAEAAFRKAIELHHVNAVVYNDLGMALGQQGKHVEAEAAFRQAIDLQPHLVQAHVNLGSALMGEQRYDQAEAALRRAVELRPDFGIARFFLGKALMRQARFEEAASVLKKTADSLPAQHPRRGQALQWQQLCQKSLLLDTRLPAILKGKEKPANAGEQLDFAELCFWKMHYLTAAAFYRDVFTAEPRRAENTPAGIRYQAACAAALAGCGHGKDVRELDDKERGRWRRQALDWLRQDLAWWAKAQTHAQVQLRLREWQADASLGGVRGQNALARLPDGERKQWERLWSDVDALLRRVMQPE